MDVEYQHVALMLYGLNTVVIWHFYCSSTFSMFQIRSINVRCEKSASVKKSTARYYRYIIVLEEIITPSSQYYNVIIIIIIILLLNIASKLKQKSELLNDEVRSKEEEKRRRREAMTRLKAQQRSEVRITIIIMM